MNTTPERTPTPPPGGVLLLLNWLVPGLGFWLCRRRTRGLMQFLLVTATFGLGLGLRGGVDWPAWSLNAPDFNLINNFTFIIQMGAGLPALLSLFADVLHLPFLGGQPPDPYYELGGFYLIVAGALNYFATSNLYDRIIHPHPRFLAQEGLAAKEPTVQP